MSFEMEMEDYREDKILERGCKKCIVTGGAGFIGSHLVDRLISDGHEVHVLDDLSTGKRENVNDKATFSHFDLGNLDLCKIQYGWKQAWEGADIVFHLAAKARVQPSIDNPIEFNQVNVNGTLNMLKTAVEYGVKRFIFTSSSSVYGDVKQKDLPTSEFSDTNPLSPYALQKLIGEQYCKLYSKLYGLETASLRYFNVYGDRMSLDGAYRTVIPIFTKQRLDGEPMTIRGDGEQRRDFTYVGDVVEANIQVGFDEHKLRGAVLNVGNGDNRSVNEIANMIGGDRVNIEPVIEPQETLADNRELMECFNWKQTMKIEDWIKTYKETLGL